MACFAGLFMGLSASATPVSRENARTVATNFARSAQLNITIHPTKGMADAAIELPFNNFYVFTGSSGKGFVIVSADDCVEPILAYSDKAPFVWEDMPDNVRAWLQGYEDEIQYRRDYPGDHSAVATWDALLNATTDKPLTKSSSTGTVQPLIETRWDQSPLYNAHCPRHHARRYCPILNGDIDTVSGSVQAVTGCVATSMAQVMRYWNWPPHGRGSYSYSYPYTETLIYETTVGDTTYRKRRSTTRQYTNTLSATFGDTVLAWSDMPDTLGNNSTSAEIEAVATLMHSLGIALNMRYGLTSSAIGVVGNTLGDHTIEEVLRDYFYYSYTTTSVQQRSFSMEEWKALLRHELDESRPIIYNGSSTSGEGHSFVCDGYDDNGRFHFNWGWGGYCDGYYTIGALNPEDGGIGAAAGNDYNMHGTAIVGIQPAATMHPEDGTTTVLAIANDMTRGSVTGSGSYHNWTETVTLTANANDGYYFVQWSDGCRYNPRRLIATGGYQAYTAIFDTYSGGDVSYFGSMPSRFSGYNHTNSIPEWGIRIPYSMLGEGYVLNRVTFTGYAGTYSVKVYSGGNTPSEGELVYTSENQTISASVGRIINISTNIAVTADEDIWVTLYSTNGVRCVTPNQIANSNGHWDYYNGNWVNNSTSNMYPYLILCHFEQPVYCPVTALTATSISGSGATIGWTAPTGASPSSYTVAYGTGYQPEQMHTIAIASTTTTCSLTDLTNHMEYHVYVRANYENDGRHSNWEQLTFTTTDVTDPVVVGGTADDPSMGFVAGCGIYERGAIVTIQAIPMVGYTFVGWEDDNTAGAARTFTAIDDVEYTAMFRPQGYPFAANSDNETLGSVAVEGESSYTYNGITHYPYLSTVMLNATANEGARFVYWDDGNTTNPRYCTVLEQNATYTAHFEATAKGGVTVTNQGQELTINTTTTEPVRIYDMLGRLHYADNPAGTTRITVALPAGVYIIRVGSNYSEKIIVR